MSENIFRISSALILFTCIGISFYHRRKADKATGEKISRKVDGTVMMTVIKIFGVPLWLSPILYLINPVWMAWSKISLPEILRWFGIIIGVLCTMGVYWLFSSIGNSISPTSATRQKHTLSTKGPYRWIRHPLYTAGSTLFISLGFISDNWFIALLGILAFITMAIRVPKEEANLIEKFGSEYREYMKTTGRFLPKIIYK